MVGQTKQHKKYVIEYLILQISDDAKEKVYSRVDAALCTHGQNKTDRPICKSRTERSVDGRDPFH